MQEPFEKDQAAIVPKDYVPPVLKNYGDMRSLTAGTKGGTKGDGPDLPGGPATRVVS